MLQLYLVRKLNHHQPTTSESDSVVVKKYIVGPGSQNNKYISINSRGYCCHGKVVQSLDNLLLCVDSNLFPK